MTMPVLLQGPTSGNYLHRLLSAEDYDNRATLSHGQMNVTAAGTAEQMASLAIPHGFAVVIKAKPGNTGNIFLGSSKANAESSTLRFTLQPNEKVELKIDNLNLVWLDAATSGEGVEYLIET